MIGADFDGPEGSQWHDPREMRSEAGALERQIAAAGCLREMAVPLSHREARASCGAWKLGLIPGDTFSYPVQIFMDSAFLRNT